MGQIGLVRKSITREQLMSEARRVVEKIVKGPRDATQLTERAQNLWVAQAAPAFDASIAFELLNFMGLMLPRGRRA